MKALTVLAALALILASCAVSALFVLDYLANPSANKLFPLLVLEVCLAFYIWQGLKALSKL